MLLLCAAVSFTDDLVPVGRRLGEQRNVRCQYKAYKLPPGSERLAIRTMARDAALDACWGVTGM